MPKRQYQTIKRRKKSLAPIITIVAIVFVLIIIGIAAGLFMASTTVSNIIDNKNVPITCSVSGNDIVIIILESERASEVRSIEMKMEGYTIPPGYSKLVVPDGDTFPKKLIYENVAAGIYNDLQISITATFTNGKSSIIWMDTVNLT